MKMLRRKPCKTCPFMRGTTNIGAPDWLVDLIAGLTRESLDHSCHVTDPKADGFIGGKDSHCWGFLGMLKKSNQRHCIGPKAAEDFATGKLDWREISMKGCFRHPVHAVLHHAETSLAELSKVEE